MTKTCGNCKFWVVYIKHVRGICHRHAPKIFESPLVGNLEEPHSWPPVNVNSSCGDFEQRDEKGDEPTSVKIEENLSVYANAWEVEWHKDPASLQMESKKSERNYSKKSQTR